MALEGAPHVWPENTGPSLESCSFRSFFQERVQQDLSVVGYMMVYLATRQLKYPLLGSSNDQAQAIGGATTSWA